MIKCQCTKVNTTWRRLYDDSVHVATHNLIMPESYVFSHMYEKRVCWARRGWNQSDCKSGALWSTSRVGHVRIMSRQASRWTTQRMNSLPSWSPRKVVLLLCSRWNVNNYDFTKYECKQMLWASNQCFSPHLRMLCRAWKVMLLMSLVTVNCSGWCPCFFC